MAVREELEEADDLDIMLSDTLRKALFRSQLMSFLAVCSLALNVIFSLGAFQLSSQMEVKVFPYAPRFQYSRDVVSFEPFSFNMSTFRSIAEMFVRQYIEMRFTFIPDRNEMEFRWGPGGWLYMLSNYSQYQEYLKRYKVKNFEGLFRRFSSYYSAVIPEITSVTVSPDNSEEWEVFFTLRIFGRQPLTLMEVLNPNSNEKSLYRTVKYRASITFGQNSSRIRLGVLVNPLGFVITDYSESLMDGTDK